MKTVNALRASAPVVVVLLLTALVGGWFITQGSFDFFAPGQHLGSVYDSMGARLLRGDVGVDSEVIGSEAFNYNGKARAYFLPVPAIPRAILNRLMPHLYGRWSRLFLSTAVLLTVIGAVRLYIEMRRWQLPLSSARAAGPEALIALSSGLGCTSLYLCGGAYVYHEAIGWAACWAVGAAVFIVRYWRTGSQKVYVLACACAVLAFFSRLTVGIGALGLIGLAAFFPRQKDWRVRWIAAGTVAGVLGLFVAYNYARFGTMFDSVPIRMAANFSKVRLEKINGSLLSAAVIPQNLVAYGLAPNLSATQEFPWLAATPGWVKDSPGRVYDGQEPFASVAASMPLLGILGMAGLFAAGRRVRADVRPAMLLAFLSLPAGVLLAFLFLSERYLHDAMPLLLAAACFGLVWIEPWRARMAVRLALWLLAGWGVAAMFALTFDWQYRYAWGTTPPERIRQLQTISKSLTRLYQSFRESGARELITISGPAPAGWCGHPELLFATSNETLYRCESHQWTTLKGAVVENLLLELPHFRSGQFPEPVISAGSGGNAAVVFLAYGDRSIQVGLEQSGGVVGISEKIEARPGGRIRLMTVLDPVSRRASVFVNGREVFRREMAITPWEPSEILRGGKHPGGPILSAFTGRILEN